MASEDNLAKVLGDAVIYWAAAIAAAIGLASVFYKIGRWLQNYQNKAVINVVDQRMEQMKKEQKEMKDGQKEMKDEVAQYGKTLKEIKDMMESEKRDRQNMLNQINENANAISYLQGRMGVHHQQQPQKRKAGAPIRTNSFSSEDHEPV